MPFLVPTNPVVTVSGTIPVISTGGSTPVISVQDATVEQKGAVQLEDSVSSDSVTKAATSKSVKETYDYATTVSGSLQIGIDGKSDVGHIHDDRYYTEAEVDDLIITVSGGSDDHSELNDLDFASAGHTGFASTEDLITVSGTLQTDIDGKSGVGHDHDDRYYTESEVDGLITSCVPIATSGDYTIPTGKSFIGGDEFSVIGADTLSIEGTGRMILVG